MSTFEEVKDDPKLIGFMFEPPDMQHLEDICKALFGDGSHLTSDKRRDLANLMRTVLNKADAWIEDTPVAH